MTDVLFWNEIAEKYARQPVADPDAFERKIAIATSRIRPEHVVLDLGCGTGSLTLRLAPFAAHVHGLDVSPEMIRIANEKARVEGIANVTFHVGAFAATFNALAPASVDVIYAGSLLHLLEDRAAALARIHALLKPGGLFFSSTPCLGESWLPYRPLLYVLRALGKAPRVQVFSKHALAAELRAVGFVEVTQPDVGATKNIAFVIASKSPFQTA